MQYATPRFATWDIPCDPGQNCFNPLLRGADPLLLVNSKPSKNQLPKYNILVQARSSLPEKSLLLHALHTISVIVDSGCLCPILSPKQGTHSRFNEDYFALTVRDTTNQMVEYLKGSSYPWLSHVQQSNPRHLEYTPL